MNNKLTLVKYEFFHIHGDNIVECERGFSLVKSALSNLIVSVSQPYCSVACPRYDLHLTNKDKPIKITFYPGFGRWDHNILDSIRERGGILREAADVIVTGVKDQKETPLFAIEFCGALPAGNQAWQRSGRAFSFGAANVPYLYISELGGYELDNNRVRKAPRMPNPAIPFSYLSFSIERNTPVFPIFITAPGADETSRRFFKDEFADAELAQLVRAILVEDDHDVIFERLQLKVLSFIKKRGESSRRGETLSAEQWQRAFDEVDNCRSISEYLLSEIKQPWSKIAYINDLTDRAKNLMELAKLHGIGLTSTKLPMCLLGVDQRQEFARGIEALYPKLENEFITWLRRQKPLAICWIMGFKPRGDDARPDRGLPPLTRMLIGTDHDMLSVVYGPAPSSTWTTLISKPGELAQRNGLWEAILETSDALLVESATDQVSKHGYIRSHWETEQPEAQSNHFFVQPKPKRLGENDVDTALHLLLAHLSGEQVFEGMCNPPGGDWSGVSVIDSKTGNEFRWLSLPRVSGPKTKRPDHVFQLFGVKDHSVILSIESKETPQSVETNIGPRLIAYLEFLLGTSASIEKPLGANNWKHSSWSINFDDYLFASAAAFISDDVERIQEVIARAATDILFSASFDGDGTKCTLGIWPITEIGRCITKFLENLELNDSFIEIDVYDQ